MKMRGLTRVRGCVSQERGNLQTGMAFTVASSRNVVVRGIRQHMSGSFCFFDSASFNTTFDRCTTCLGWSPMP